jgi:hypothetical protein
LVVLFSGEVDPDATDRASPVAAACEACAVVGALISLPETTDPGGSG